MKLPPLVRPPISPERLVTPIPRSVLVVDDDRSWRLMLTHCLEAEGFRVSTASSAPGALRLIKEEAFDLIVSDLHMPRMDGLELRDALILHHDGRPIPFIFVSGMRDEESVAAASSLGVPHFLEKRGPVSELIELAHSLAG